jgi:SAM-dependent methyltransferase
MNEIITKRAGLKDMLKASSPDKFHNFFIHISIENLFKSNPKQKFDSVLALGANHREAEELTKFPFKKIVLSGITSPDEKTKKIMKQDKRVSYKIEDMEKISFKNQSFDLIFVKEAIHHVPRPILALYEMLRLTKKAVIFIEPNETFIGNFFNFFGLTSNYEKNQVGNKKYRDNFVYRWRKEEVIKILNSYYLDSGYRVIFNECWMSNRLNMKSRFLIPFFNFFGWLMSFIPGSRGNYLSCIIFPGKDLPK